VESLREIRSIVGETVDACVWYRNYKEQTGSKEYWESLYQEGDPDATVEFFRSWLEGGLGTPADCPIECDVAYLRRSRLIVAEIALPLLSDVKSAAPSNAKLDIKEWYRNIIAELSLSAAYQVLHWDEFSAVDTVVVNGYPMVEPGSHDSVGARYLVSLLMTKRQLAGLDLGLESGLTTLEIIHGRVATAQVSSSGVDPIVPFELAHGYFLYEPLRRGQEPRRVALPELTTRALAELGADLIGRMGYEALQPDVRVDPGIGSDGRTADCMRRHDDGSLVLIRFMNQMDLLQVSEIDGLLEEMSLKKADRGVLVTLGGISPGAFARAVNSPIQLYDGDCFSYLLQEHAGIYARIGEVPHLGDPLPERYEVGIFNGSIPGGPGDRGPTDRGDKAIPSPQELVESVRRVACHPRADRGVRPSDMPIPKQSQVSLEEREQLRADMVLQIRHRPIDAARAAEEAGELVIASDCWLLAGDVQAALALLPVVPLGGGDGHVTNRRVFLQLVLGQHTAASDVFSLFMPRVTAWAVENHTIVLDEMEGWLAEQRNAGREYCGQLASDASLVWSGGIDLVTGHCSNSWYPNFYALPKQGTANRKLQREIENRARRRAGIPLVGEGWVSETQLFNQLHDAFRDETTVEQHGHPNGLGRQHLDVWFPQWMIGIEFQGLQHDQPIEFFGGYEGWLSTKRLDEVKRSKCRSLGIRLIEVRTKYDLDTLVDEVRSAAARS
jgi:hypothetical protein